MAVPGVLASEKLETDKCCDVDRFLSRDSMLPRRDSIWSIFLSLCPRSLRVNIACVSNEIEPQEEREMHLRTIEKR